MAYSFTRSTSACSSEDSLNVSTPDPENPPLRVFLIQTAKGLFSSSGGYKANLCLLRYLASRGYSVRQICYSHRGEIEAYIQTMAKSCRWDPQYPDFVSFLQQEITDFFPTHVMFNDRLSMQTTSATEMPELNACRVAVIHTAEQLPFGPFFGGMPGHVSSPSEFKLLRDLDGIWSVSEAIKRYAFEHGRLAMEFFVHHPWTYLDERKHAVPIRLHNWNRGFVGMVNPCKVKGSQILAELAKSCPQLDFLVYKSWGFDDRIGNHSEQMQNVMIRSPTTDMEEAWRDIKVLLVPSLWFEAWGIVVIEAHLRGIPVIASDAGALKETMLGLDYVIPVNPIRGELDKEGEYIIPQQDIRPWTEALNRLMSDQSEYERVSNEVRNVTVRWLKNIDQTALERWMINLSSYTGKTGKI
ncbi:hypothetical protein N0V94_003507 [Neodidymelliopsis sp. IMI 364377]|nr:hypothetical protein N0V94_003507 [Neodidymelliopsis sp. IMI 364377]